MTATEQLPISGVRIQRWARHQLQQMRRSRPQFSRLLTKPPPNRDTVIGAFRDVEVVMALTINSRRLQASVDLVRALGRDRNDAAIRSD